MPFKLAAMQRRGCGRVTYVDVYAVACAVQRVEADQEWSLFCPNEAPGLADCWGDEFETLFTK